MLLPPRARHSRANYASFSFRPCSAHQMPGASFRVQRGFVPSLCDAPPPAAARPAAPTSSAPALLQRDQRGARAISLSLSLSPTLTSCAHTRSLIYLLIDSTLFSPRAAATCRLFRCFFSLSYFSHFFKLWFTGYYSSHFGRNTLHFRLY